MGRWAEVYFTSPPERREQAVLELVRELEGKNPTSGGQFGAPTPLAPEAASQPVFTPPIFTPDLQNDVHSQSDVPPMKVPCHACGRELPPSQRYCGMCGAPQRREEAVADAHVADLVIEDQQIEDSTQSATFDNRESQYLSPVPDAYEPRSSTNEVSLFQTGRDDEYRDRDEKATIDFQLYTSSFTTLPRLYRCCAGNCDFCSRLHGMAQRPSDFANDHVASQAPPVAVQPDASTPAQPDSSKTTSPETEKTAAPEHEPAANQQTTAPESRLKRPRQQAQGPARPQWLPSHLVRREYARFRQQ